MNWLNRNRRRSVSTSAHWAWFLPILALAPFSLAAKGCSNSGVVGDDCPTAAECPAGTAGTNGSAGASDGGKTCGGIVGASCNKGEFCSFSPDAKCGAGDMTGTCQALPEACEELYAPVCGCDDKTYDNACSAHASGVSVLHNGACAGTDPGAKDCGGLLGKSCAAGEYCKFPPGTKCGSGDQTGTCEPKLELCTQDFEPVCGCDGKTYGNSCQAAAAGISIASQGACGGSGGGACGGRSGACAADEYCSYAPEADCGRFDAPGKCVPWQKDRGCDTVFDPVCGCDGKTYGNDCEAANVGISVDYPGKCTPPSTGKTCGGLLGEKCATDEFCDYPPEMACGIADGTGTCTTKPELCLQNIAFVCGCDGKTYNNACYAMSNGVSVASKGACK